MCVRVLPARFWAAVSAVLILGGCRAAARTEIPARPAPYLFAWAYDQDAREGDTNFLTVIDIDPASATYGQVVATAPLGSVGGMPHHTEQAMPPDGLPLFASAYEAGRVYLFDLRDPLQPQLAAEADSVPGYRLPHSFVRLDDGSVIATLQFGAGTQPGDPGGLAHFTAAGHLLATRSSADSAFAGAAIRTYALDVASGIDRVVTTSSPMEDVRTADVVQLWRLSDLTLLRTVAIPESPSDSAWRYPFEVRFLADGHHALINTYYCGFYLLSGVDGDAPAIERVLALEHPKYIGCGVPLVIGDYWIMPVSGAREILVLDISDPRHPRQMGVLTAAESTYVPHWSARDPGSDRVVLPSDADADPRILIARFDSMMGTLTWDESFRDPATGRLGVTLDRVDWPHGSTGPATPHGVVFGGGR